MGTLLELCDKLPISISEALLQLPEQVQKNLEEIRIKIGCPVFIYAEGQEYALTLPESCLVDYGFVQEVYHSILNYSIYAYQDSIAEGYVTLKGGHRVGICGKAVVEHGKPRGITNITSLNIRRASERIDISRSYYKYITNELGGFYNTILISPPKCGKTTLLRDFIRNLSHHGFKIGVCDERSELAGSTDSGFSFDLGMRTDVLDNCPKAAAMMMLIRSMSPDIIATDEIGRAEDFQALEQAVVCGVGVLTTIHGIQYQDLLKTPLAAFLQRGLFQRIIYLSSSPAVGTVWRISDGNNKTLYGRRDMW